MEKKRNPNPLGFSYRTKEVFDEDEMAAFRQKFIHFRVHVVKMSQVAVADSIRDGPHPCFSPRTIGQFENGVGANFPRIRKLLEQWMGIMEEQMKLAEEDETIRQLQKELEDQNLTFARQAKKLEEILRDTQRLRDEAASNAVLKTSTSSAEDALNEAPPIKSEPIDEAVPKKQDMDFVLLRVKDLANQRRKRSCKIYVIVDENDKIVYIGTAWDVAARLHSHRYYGGNKKLREFLKNQSTMRAYVVYEGFREECLIIEAALIGCRDELELNTFNERLETHFTKRRSNEYEAVDADGDIQMVIDNLPMNKNHSLHAKFVSGLKFLISGGFKNGHLVEIKKKGANFARARAYCTSHKPHSSVIFSSSNAENESTGPSPQVPPKRKRTNVVAIEFDEDASKTSRPKRKHSVASKTEIKKKKSLNFQSARD